MTQTTQEIGLVTDEKALRRSLRFAFANHDSVVQELIQNSRRAGATLVRISYDPAAMQLTVADDGCGIDDFSKLLTLGASGWDAQTQSNEGPYGMGFLAAIYAAKNVSVVSRGKCLAFSTDALLDDAKFALVDVPDGHQTVVVLDGFDWTNPSATIARMARGYQIPIEYNGNELNRAEAPSRHDIATPVGRIQMRCDSYNADNLRVYLQGFRVFEGRRWFDGWGDIVHLEPSLFRGKWPDRDRVIDEAQMIAVVKAQVRQAYEDKLKRMKRDLAPLDFCRNAHQLALSLGRIDVFNEIDVAPAEWFGTCSCMPHSVLDGESSIEPITDNPLFVTREEVEAGRRVIAAMDGNFPEWWGGEQGQLAWVLAYASGALFVREFLDSGHWLIRGAQLHSEAKVELTVVGDGPEGKVAGRRTHYIGGASVRLCDHAVLQCDAVRAEVHEAFIGPDERVFVPKARGADGAHVYVSGETLRQLGNYTIDDGALDEPALDEDSHEVNATVRGLLANTPERRAELALQDALRNYDELHGKAITIAVDDVGRVQVKALSDLSKDKG